MTADSKPADDSPPASSEPPVPADPPAEASDPPATLTGWSRGDRVFLLSVSSSMILLCLLHLVGPWRGSGETVEIDRLESRRHEFQIDVNQATWVEWMQLDGIGEIMARRIVEDREEQGPFSSIDDVQRVRGIGPATMKAIRPHLTHETSLGSSGSP